MDQSIRDALADAQTLDINVEAGSLIDADLGTAAWQGHRAAFLAVPGLREE